MDIDIPPTGGRFISEGDDILTIVDGQECRRHRNPDGSWGGLEPDPLCRTPELRR